MSTDWYVHQFQGTAMGGGKLTGNGQAQADTGHAASIGTAIEGLEDLPTLVRRNARPLIHDVEYRLPLLAYQGNLHRPTLGRKLDRVRYQIVNHRRQFLASSGNRERRQRAGEAQAFAACRQLVRRHHLLNQFVKAQAHRFDTLAGMTNLLEFQQAVDQTL